MKLKLRIPQLISNLLTKKPPGERSPGVVFPVRSAPPTATQLKLDTEVVLNVLLSTYRYEPLDVLQLLSKIYGKVLSTCPEDYLGFDVAGTPITPEYIQNDFFEQCKVETARHKTILKNAQMKARMN
jgi:hypothetical protein